MTTHRKYQLVKISAGDWLLPGNDGRTLWRLKTYEDGPTSGLDIPRDRAFWSVYRWAGTLAEFYAAGDDVLELAASDGDGLPRWAYASGVLLTRTDAIAEALEMESEGVAA